MYVIDNIYENVFSKKAFDTSKGYYFFNVENAPIQDNFTDFKHAWNCRKLQDIYRKTSDLEQVISEIADENKLFLEISCGRHMGLTPFILEYNPEIQCLVTDRDDAIISGWHELFNDPKNNLQRFHVNFARLDNCDLPINNDSFDYITCTFALNYLYNQNKDEFWKALEEVHRVLKKGGRLVAIEHTINVEFDMTRIFLECQFDGTLYGLYSYDEIEQIQNEFQEKRLMRDQFRTPGFVIEVEVDDEGINNCSDTYAFQCLSSKAKEICNFIEIPREKALQIEKLEKSAPYLGIKCNYERYLLVLRKL